MCPALTHIREEGKMFPQTTHQSPEELSPPPKLRTEQAINYVFNAAHPHIETVPQILFLFIKVIIYVIKY